MSKKQKDQTSRQALGIQIETLLSRSPSVVVIARKDLSKLYHLLGISGTGELSKAISVTSKPRNSHILRSPDTKLQGVVSDHGKQINLLRLYEVQNLPGFEWTYMRYYGASSSRTILIQNFVKALVDAGIFGTYQSSCTENDPNE